MYAASNETHGGLGFFTDSQKQKSIFNKKNKDKQRLVRMKLSGLFIEEKPVDAPFLSQLFSSSAKGIQLRRWIEEIDEMAADGTTATITKKWFGRDMSM